MPRVISGDGTTIAYDRRGSGPVLILVLGALNRKGSAKKLAQALSERFTLVSYDRRGRGNSGDTLPYSVDKEVGDLAALVDELGGRACLYGHSSGGALALMAAQKLGSKVARLALYEIPYDRDATARQAFEAYKSSLRQLLAEDSRGEAVALFVRSVGVTDKQIDAMRPLPLWNSLTAMAPTLQYDTVEIMERYPTIDAGAVETPTLVMFGTQSPAFMARTAEELAQAMPHATLRPMEGQAHDVKPAVLAPVLAEFFLGEPRG